MPIITSEKYNRIGIHVSLSSNVLDDKKKAKSIYKAIERDTDALNIKCAQIFTHGPRSFSCNKYDKNLLKQISYKKEISVHTPYPMVTIWKINEDNINDNKIKSTIKNIDNQIKACQDIGAWGLVFHINKYLPKDVAYVINNVLLPIATKYKIKIILEMVSSKADNKTYETPAKINKLNKLINNSEWWCWCIDTAHLWGAGVNIQEKKNVDIWLKDLNMPEKIEMIHLNGSSAELGSGRDKHEIPFTEEDIMWYGIKPEESGLYSFVNFAAKKNISIICEINRGKQIDTIKCINIIKEIANNTNIN